MLKATWRFDSVLDKERIIRLIEEHSKTASEFGLLECNLWILSEVFYSHLREERKYLLEELWAGQKEFENWMRSEERKKDACYKYLIAQNVVFVAYVDAKLSRRLLVPIY